MKEAEIQKISIKQIFRRVGMALQEADVKMSIKRTNNKPSITFKFLSCIIPPKKIAYSNFPNNLLAKTIPFS